MPTCRFSPGSCMKSVRVNLYEQGQNSSCGAWVQRGSPYCCEEHLPTPSAFCSLAAPLETGW